MKKCYHLLWIFLSTCLLYAQSPPNLTSNVICSYSFSNNVTTIAANYDCARTEEETQLGVTLPNITMPSQAAWDAMTLNEKGLYLINQERTARGVTYTIPSTVTPKALPLEGLNTNLKNTAQSYADYLVSVNQFTHFATPAHPLGAGPFDRVENTPTVGSCNEFLNRAENLYISGTSGSSINEHAAIAQAIWLWNYQDASSSWGHREANLLQDYNLGGTPGNTYGYDDNFHSAGSEGFIGFGVKQAAGYNPFSWPGVNTGIVVVMKIFDPANLPGCDTALPINLSQFVAQSVGNRVSLAWTVANPQPNAVELEQASVYLKNGVEVTEDFKSVNVPLQQNENQYHVDIASLSAGTYAFRVKIGNTYSEVQKVTVQEVPDETLVSVFPNPFTAGFQLSVISPTDAPIRIQVYNLLGQEVYQATLGQGVATQENRFDITADTWATGVYWARVESGNTLKVVKIIKR